MGAHHHQFDQQQQSQSSHASIPYMDLGNNGTLMQSQQLLEGLLPTQKVFPSSNWLNRMLQNTLLCLDFLARIQSLVLVDN